MSKDPLASEIDSRSNSRGLNYADLVEDEIWPPQSGTGPQYNRPANYSVEEWLDLMNTVGAIDVASQEYLDYLARSRSATSRTQPLSNSYTQSLPTSPHNGPANRQYAPHEFREDQLILPGGSRTRRGALLRESSTSSNSTPVEPADAPTTPPTEPPAAPPTEPPAAPIIDSPPTPPTDDNVESGK